MQVALHGVVAGDGVLGRGVIGDVALGPVALAHGLRLHVDGDGNVRDRALVDRRADRQLRDCFHVRRAHDALVIAGYIHEELVELDVLLRKRAGNVLELHAGNRKHRLLVHLGVVQAVEQVDAAGAGGCKAHAQAAGELSIGAGHKCRRFLVPHVDEANLILCLAQRLHDTVNAVAGQAEDRIDTPVHQLFYQHISSSHHHSPHLV